MPVRLPRRALLSAAARPMPLIRTARAAQGLKLGCLTDLNGPYADLTGKGSVGSVRLAIEDFARLRPGIPVELPASEVVRPLAQGGCRMVRS